MGTIRYGPPLEERPFDMQDTFDPAAFVERLGIALIAAFETARANTTPSAVADAMEDSIRASLEQVLPGGVAVGTGHVIDSKRRTSRQMDVILYEKHLCPIFNTSRDPGTSHYPCEGVIAVGEIKSRLGKRELDDAIKKIKSVKELERVFRSHTGQTNVVHRNYGAQANYLQRDFDPTISSDGDILGFVLAGTLRTATENLKASFASMAETLPDIVMSLDGDMIAAQRHTPEGSTFEPIRTAESVANAKLDHPFSYLVHKLHERFCTGATPELEAFGKYLVKPGSAKVMWRIP